jgi:LysM repeat protein
LKPHIFLLRFLAILLAVSILPLPASPPVALAASPCKASYVVRTGDTLGVLAQKFNVRIDALTKANKLYAPYYTIYVNQSLCIPRDAPAFSGAPTYATALAADFKARLQKGNLVITTSSFPKSSAYYVKAGKDARSAAKVGMFNTKSGGTLQINLVLPAKLQNSSSLLICLKNNVTDANVCRTAKS